MKLKALESFTCYPEGDNESARRDFAKDQEFEVPDSYGKILVDKGHAVAVGGKVSVKPEE